MINYTLDDCIKHLGETAGRRYWNISLEVSVNPEMALVWADDLENEADLEEDPEMEFILISWSIKLREQYRKWMIQESELFKARYK